MFSRLPSLFAKIYSQLWVQLATVFYWASKRKETKSMRSVMLLRNVYARPFNDWVFSRSFKETQKKIEFILHSWDVNIIWEHFLFYSWTFPDFRHTNERIRNFQGVFLGDIYIGGRDIEGISTPGFPHSSATIGCWSRFLSESSKI